MLKHFLLLSKQTALSLNKLYQSELQLFRKHSIFKKKIFVQSIQPPKAAGLKVRMCILKLALSCSGLIETLQNSNKAKIGFCSLLIQETLFVAG
ncbi:MAG TPA: hypothetical protein DCQ31_14910 [Bacteroidales bacterium]|nr:hypothetical protein [Bacteroidales bacterium]